MRKIAFIALLICPLIIFGQNKTDSKGRKQGKWEVKFENSENFRYKGQFLNDKPQGKFIYFYPNGIVSAVSVFETNGTVARTTMFDIEGQAMGYGKYSNQLKDSTWTYFQNGKVISTIDYKDGKREGKKYTFYEDGKVYEETTFENDIENGIWNMFYPTGKVKITCNYLNGNKDGKITYFYSDGKIETEGFYKNTVQNGFWRYYDHRGAVAKEVYYKLGKIILEGRSISEELQQLKAEGKL